MGGHFPAAGVDAQGQPLRELAAHVTKPLGPPDGQRADHQAAEAQIEQLANGLFVANATAQLAGEVHGLDDRGGDGVVPRLALAGAVEIDEVQVAGPPFGPLPRNGDSIVAENRFTLVVALLETDTFASTQVDCRPDFHPLRTPD